MTSLIRVLAITASVCLATPSFAQSTPRGEPNSSNMSPPSGNSDSGNNGIGTAGSNTGNNGTASSTINPGNSSLAAAPKPAVSQPAVSKPAVSKPAVSKPGAAPNRGTGDSLENEPAVGGGSQGAGTSK